MSKLTIYDVTSIRDGQLSPKNDVKGPILVTDLDCTILTEHFSKFILSYRLGFASPENQVKEYLKHCKARNIPLFRGIDSLIDTWTKVIEHGGEIAIASSNSYSQAVAMLLKTHLIPQINAKLGFNCTNKITGFLGSPANAEQNPKEHHYELINQVYPNAQGKIGLDDEPINVNGMKQAGIVAHECPEGSNINIQYTEIKKLVTNPDSLKIAHTELEAENILLRAKEEETKRSRQQEEAKVNAEFAKPLTDFAAQLKARRAASRASTASSTTSLPTPSTSSPPLLSPGATPTSPDSPPTLPNIRSPSS